MMRAVVLLVACAGCEFTPGVLASPDGRAIDGARDALVMRVGVIARWELDETGGAIVRDSEAQPLDLTIEQTSAVEWSGGALTVKQPVRIWSPTAATKLVGRITTDRFSIEAWVRPANATQNGPARIVTLSLDGLASSFTLGQENQAWVFRVRRTTSDNVGRPELISPAVIQQTPALSHVVATYDHGTRVLYVDGAEVKRDQLADDLQLDSAHQAAIAGEPNADQFGLRSWIGELHRIVIYDRTLEATEVAALHTGGV